MTPDHIKHANRVIDQQVEAIIDDIREIRARLDQLETEARAIETTGYDAPQFATAISAGSMNVDVRRYAELDARVRTVNALRDVVAMSERS